MLTAPAVVSPALDGAARHVAATALADRDRAEAQFRLTPPLASAITQAGFPRHFVPAQWGGTAGTFTALLQEVPAIAEICPSTAWCATLFAAHSRLAAYLPQQAQHDLWNASPNVRIAASVMPPQGEASPCSGGWRLTGQWHRASGVDVAEWILLASWTLDVSGERQHRIFAVPRTAVAVHDTWRPLGLRGTGSNTVTADDVHVPGHRTMLLDDLLQPQPNAARCHSVPYPMVAALMFAMPALGAARAAIRGWLSDTSRRKLPDGRTALQSSSTAATLTHASADIEAACHFLESSARRADRGPVSPLAVATARRDATVAAAKCAEATDRLFRAAGTNGLTDSNAVQRAWRDVTAVSRHAALDVDSAALAYADALHAAPGDSL